MNYFIIASSLTLIMLVLSMLISKKSNMDKEKTSPFECGFDPYKHSRNPFSLRFFKVAIIFLIFDVEIMLVLPIPLMNTTMSLKLLFYSSIIMTVILLGLIYEWQQKSLDWVK